MEKEIISFFLSVHLIREPRSRSVENFVKAPARPNSR
jgi:hypothetical protein